MKTLTSEEREVRRQLRWANRKSREEQEARMAAQRAQAQKALETNRCPDCGAGVHSNSALSGWVQCDRSGAEGFRKDPTGPSCSWQGFWK